MAVTPTAALEVAPPPEDPIRRGSYALVAVAGLTSFTSAWLVFSVQPMATKMILPRLGGGAGVWNTAMVFFQIGLLAGYALTHFTTTRLSPRGETAVHVGLVAAAGFLLPIEIGGRWVPPTSSPGLWLIGVFALTVGLPYLALASISPLVQRWFALSDHPRASDPYFLYAVSNAGSLLGLATYPLVIEPWWSLGEQSRVWTIGYAVFAAGILALVVMVRPDRRRNDAIDLAEMAELTDIADPLSSRGRWRHRLRWIGLAFVPSSLTLGVTTFLTTDIASIPLFWVVPLGIFLLTYIVAFGTKHLNLGAINVAVVVLVTASMLTFLARPEIHLAIPLHLLTLGAVGLAFHGLLAESRPAASRLTEFFLCTSVGGLLGGMFNALIAPVLFPLVIEYALVLAIAAGVAASRLPSRRRVGRVELVLVGLLLAVLATSSNSQFRLFAVVAIPFVLYSFRTRPLLACVAIAVIAAAGPVVALEDTVHVGRNWYGAFKVKDVDGFRLMMHGTTVHGGQALDPERAREPVTYYSRSGPIGEFIETYDDDPALRDVAILGLGAGVLAAYSEPERSMTFFEVDPEIRDVAMNPKYFTWLSDAPGPVDVVIGDGRLALRDTDDEYGVLIVDAFSSDAIPVHLLTTEAMQLYFDRLGPGGFLAVHISNRYIDLEPVIAANAEKLGLTVAAREDAASAEEARLQLKAASRWVVLSENDQRLAPLFANGWDDAAKRADVRAWTDNYSNLVRSLNL